MYGYSKHLFDCMAKRKGWLPDRGLEIFQRLRPERISQGRHALASSIRSIRSARQSVMRLFKSYCPEYRDGEQKRDFIYIKDALAMTLFFLERPEVNGIFNIGTGVARSWNNIAKALFAAADQPLNVEYIPMPEKSGEIPVLHLRRYYQAAPRRMRPYLHESRRCDRGLCQELSGVRPRARLREQEY